MQTFGVWKCFSAFLRSAYIAAPSIDTNDCATWSQALVRCARRGAGDSSSPSALRLMKASKLESTLKKGSSDPLIRCVGPVSRSLPVLRLRAVCCRTTENSPQPTVGLLSTAVSSIVDVASILVSSVTIVVIS